MTTKRIKRPLKTTPLHFTKATLPGGFWTHYAKRTYTAARRIEGPFSVETRLGTLTCEDGWLAVDTEGYPYPIDAEEFDRIYVAAMIMVREEGSP